MMYHCTRESPLLISNIAHKFFENFLVALAYRRVQKVGSVALLVARRTNDGCGFKAY